MYSASVQCDCSCAPCICKASLTLPTVHLNGTSADSLLEQLQAAISSIRDARNALAEASPNARDYYPQGPDAFTRARNEYAARDEAMATVARELMEIAEHVAGIRDARESARTR